MISHNVNDIATKIFSTIYQVVITTCYYVYYFLCFFFLSQSLILAAITSAKMELFVFLTQILVLITSVSVPIATLDDSVKSVRLFFISLAKSLHFLYNQFLFLPLLFQFMYQILQLVIHPQSFIPSLKT